jgi:pimeloyl-ACP methyl ester carboxylesterase
MFHNLKRLFGRIAAPAVRHRKPNAVRLQYEGMEKRSLMAAAVPSAAPLNQPALAAAVSVVPPNAMAVQASSVPSNPVNFTPGSIFKLGNYWISVPAGYDTTHKTPTQLLVWSHGCGGKSQFDIAHAAAKPGGPLYIAIAVDGREGGCWNVATDGPLITSAIADIKTHFNIDPRRVVLGGYSSGGELSYRLAFTRSTEFAGVVVQATGPTYGGTFTRQVALAAPNKFKIVHVAYTGDNTFPLGSVRTELNAFQAAGFPVQLIERAGNHWNNDTPTSGTNFDLKTILLPHLGTTFAASKPLPPPASNPPRVDFLKTTDWGTGFGGDLKITNSTATAVKGWTMEFDFTGNIYQSWGFQVVTKVGNRYTVRGTGWGTAIAAGQSLTVGFNATWGNPHTVPTGFAFKPNVAAKATVAHAVRTDWGNGFTGDLKIASTAATAINGWTMEFDFTGNIYQTWGFEIISKVGNRYTIRGTGWGTAIAAGQSITVGFNATWGSSKIAPSGFVFKA